MNVEIDREICIRCQHCTRVCPLGALSAETEQDYPVYNPESCIACGHCAAVCPTDAISLDMAGLRLHQPNSGLATMSSPVNGSDFQELIMQRRSIRAYDQDRVVSKPEVLQLLAAAAQAPTGGNRRNICFKLYTPQETSEMERLAQDYYVHETENSWLKDLILTRNYQVLLGAPSVLCLYADPAISDFDCGLLSQNLLLMGHSLGLGLCCNGIFKRACFHSPKMQNLVRLEAGSDWSLRMAFSIGYPAPEIDYGKVIERQTYRLD